MSLDDTSSRAMLKSTLQGFLENLLGPRAGEPQVAALDAWTAMCKGGWLEAGQAETLRGQEGGGYADLLAIMEQFGASLFPGPVEAVGAYLVPLLSAVGAHGADSSTWLSSLLSGDERPACRPSWAASLDDDDVQLLTLETKGTDEFQLNGSVSNLQLAPDATHCYLPAIAIDGSWRIVRIPTAREGVLLTGSDTVDLGLQSGGISLVDVKVESSDLFGDGCADCVTSFQWAAMLYSLALDAGAIGSTESVLARTVDYTSNRQQFGAVIGSFQALQHKIANAVISLELARSLLYSTLVDVVSDSPEAKVGVAASRLYASGMYVDAMEASIQSHGGYGFTWEQGIHFAYRRAVYGRQLASSPSYNRRVVAKSLGV